jgi:hypothetical protein
MRITISIDSTLFIMYRNYLDKSVETQIADCIQLVAF